MKFCCESCVLAEESWYDWRVQGSTKMEPKDVLTLSEMMLKLNSGGLTFDPVDAWKTQRGALQGIDLVDQPHLKCMVSSKLEPCIAQD